MLQVITEHWLEILGGAATLIATIVAVVEIKKHFLDDQVRCRRIVRASTYRLFDDWRWRGIELLHNRHFESEVRDPVEDIRNWIGSWRNIRKKNRDMDEILYCAYKGRIVLGYIYANYYFSEGFLFLSYFVADGETQVEKDNVKYKLIESLILLVHNDYSNFKGIVAELEEFGNVERDDEIVVVEKGKRLFRNFRIAVNKFNKTWNVNYVFGRLELEYYQPLLGDVEVERFGTSYGNDKYRLWLVVVLSVGSIAKRQQYSYVDKALAESLLSFVFKRLYWDAWTSDIYRTYLIREFEKHAKALGAEVEVYRG